MSLIRYPLPIQTTQRAPVRTKTQAFTQPANSALSPDANVNAAVVACSATIPTPVPGIGSLFLTTTAADAAVTVGAGTKRATAWNAGAASTLQNVNTVAGPTSGVQLTDSVTAGTNGTAQSWYTAPLQAVNIVGQIVAQLWGRESSTSANAAACFRVERCSGNGTILSTIVDQSTAGSTGSLEFATTAGGVAVTCTMSALNVVDTTLAGGDRLRISLWIDDAAGQGGSGSMATGFNTQLYVNGPTGAAGQSAFTFTETLFPAVTVNATVAATRVACTTTIPTPIVSAGGSASATAAAVAGVTTIPTPTVGTAPLGSPSGGPWLLVFEDHFDIGTVPNPAVWADHLIEGDFFRCNDNSDEVEWYPHNKRGLSIASSALTLTARLEDPTTVDPLCPATLPSGNAGTYTSGMIQSKPGFAYTFGYVETRCRFNTQINGGWPAFWTMSADANWSEEFDIVEYIASAGPTLQQYIDVGNVNPQFDIGVRDTAYHTYGMRWTATDVTWFIDGVQTFTYSGAIKSVPCHLIFNLAMRTTAAGSSFTADIDYFRVWTTQGVPAQPVITSLTPANGIPTAGTLQVAFGAVSGATSYRATPCPVDGQADGFTGGRHMPTAASSPITISGLQNGVRYGVTVAASNATGYSIESAIAGGSFAPTTPTAVAGITTIPTPTVTTTTFVTPAVVNAVTTIPTPAPKTGETVTAAVVAAATTIPTPVITASGNATATATVVAAVTTIPVPAVSTGEVAAAAVVAAATTIPVPTISTVVNLTPAVVNATVTIPAVTGQASSTMTPAVVAAVTTIPTPAISAGGNATVAAAVVAAVTTVPTPTLSTGETVTAAVAVAVATIPTPGISAGGSAAANAAVVTASTTIPTPTVTSSATVSAAVASGVTTVPVPVVTSAAFASATVVAAPTAIPVPTVTVTASATVTPAVVAASTSIPTPGIVAGGSATVNAVRVAATTTIPAPGFSSSASITAVRVFVPVTIPGPVIQAGSTVQAVVVLVPVTIPLPSPRVGPPPIPPITVTGSSSAAVSATGSTSTTITLTGGSDAPLVTVR